MSFDAVKKLGTNGHNNLDVELRRYLREIKRQLHCPRSRKKIFLNQFAENLFQYIEEYPLATFSDVVTEFGKPEDIASSFIEQADAKDIRKSLKVGRRIFWAVLAVAVIVAAVVIGIFSFDLWMSNNYRDGYYEEIVTPNAPSFPDDLNSSTQIF